MSHMNLRTGAKTRKELINEILDSLTLEELAIAHLINAQAGKIQAFTGPNGTFPTSPTNKQINEFQRSVARILEALTEKQKLFVRALEIIKELEDEEQEKKDEDG